MTTVAKLIVTEDHGIRRFLYPLKFSLTLKSPDLLVAVKDDAGNLLPSETIPTRNKLLVRFAISLAPYERRKLSIIVSEQAGQIPDPIHVEVPGDGSVICRQERIATTIAENLDLTSVRYDGVEHLAGPVTFTLNAEQASPELLRCKSIAGELAYFASGWRHYPANDRFGNTAIELTACKSWAHIVHTVDVPAAGSILSLDIPLAAPALDEIPTCDFGLGNGVYSKIDGDDVLFEADFYGKKPYCCWQISRLIEGIQRVDYQGDATTIKTLSQQLYFHWTIAKRSLAVAITDLPSSTTHIQALLGRTGKIHLSVVLGDIPIRKAKLGVVLHFLNDIPAIAAATNPASILCDPTVIVRS